MHPQIHTETNRKEIKKHGDYGFPVHISPKKSILQYDNGMFPWHWHPEIELTLILDGEMRYLVNDSEYILKKGEGLFCNSNALHSGSSIDGQACPYLSITFHPRFIYGYENSILQTKYVDFILSNSSWGSLKLTEQTAWQREVLEQIRYLGSLSKETSADYELAIHRSLESIWHHLFLYYCSRPEKNTYEASSLERLKSILSYIHEHYQEPLTLEEISANVNICRSECCRFFKKHMKMTLFEYVMFYRIQKSLALLKKGESITKTAGMVGFSNPCYYGKIFKRYMHCSPVQYRKSTAK